MYDEKNKLAHRKKVRTYSKRLVTTLSTIYYLFHWIHSGIGLEYSCLKSVF